MNRRSFLQTLSLTLALPAGFRGLLPSPASRGSVVTEDDEDALICSKKFELAVRLGLRRKPINEVIVAMGRTFLGTDYVAHALEVPGEERLVVNMRGLDCVSFCENALVLGRCIKKGTTTFDEYKAELQYIRYRGGVIDGYPSRLHYFSDYIDDNEKKGVLRNVTQEIGGVPYRKTINFMSSHPESYRQLRENPEYLKIIRRQEEEISAREMFYLPKEHVEGVAGKIASGDIIAITTDIPGLDIAHTGLALRQDGELHLMHAPIVGQKVTITETTLAGYLAGNKRQTGIMVARALEPM